MTKRTNRHTLHTANNAIRLCREHTSDKLKLSFKGTGRGPPPVGLENLWGGTKDRGWVGVLKHHTQLSVQYNVMH